MTRRRGPLAALAAVLCASLHGGGAPAAAVPDFSRLVAVGDGWTAGFVNGNLFDGASQEPPVRLGQGQSWAARLAEAAGARATLPLVSGNGRPRRNTLVRAAGACAFDPRKLQVNELKGDGGRSDPSARATIVAVPFQKVRDALERTWTFDPGDPASATTDEDDVLGFPWAAEGAPKRSQVATAVALSPTFAAVWLGIEDVLAAARLGSVSGATPPAEFATRIRAVVDALAEGGVPGAIATIPDPTALPYFVGERELLGVLRRASAEGDPKPTHDGLLIFFGVSRSSYLVRRREAFQGIDQINAGGPAPLAGNLVLTGREARRIRAIVRSYNRAIAAAAAAHGWALVDTGRVIQDWRRGVVVDGRTLTTAYFGGLFDLAGQYPSPTGHALLAKAFVEAIDARYGTSLAAPDAAAVLRDDPLAPCE